MRLSRRDEGGQQRVDSECTGIGLLAGLAVVALRAAACVLEALAGLAVQYEAKEIHVVPPCHQESKEQNRMAGLACDRGSCFTTGGLGLGSPL